ncbi:MAG: ABC transporter substrate-binding protein [Chloroflexi bacterium]|nr:ABC transporter substrate-binding protein [Chloroflexota bacterium]MBI3169730.1 ABC transporter substrate-binding protein [Chloroflexota bacterium]
MKKNLFVTVAVLFILPSLLLGACSAVAPVPTAEPDKVTVQLSWFHGVEYSGFYAAVEQGYYTDVNIEAVLNAGGPDINPLDEVKNGNAQFGITSGDSLITAQSAEQKFVAVATIFKENPLAITSLKKDSITSPEDLIGKTVGVYSPDLSNFFDIPFLALISRTDLDRDSMNYAVIEDFQGANEIKAGNMDAMSGMFATDQQVMASQAGDELNFIYYKDYGYDVYINTIFVTEELRQSNPDLVRRFIQATLDGYQYAIENTDEVAALALTYDETLDLAYQQAVMQAQIPFINTGDGQLGTMTENIWNNTQDILLEFNLISKPIDLSTVYTNEFAQR